MAAGSWPVADGIPLGVYDFSTATASGVRRWLAAPAENGPRTADCGLHNLWRARHACRSTPCVAAAQALDTYPDQHPAFPDDPACTGRWPKPCWKLESRLSSRPPVNVSGVGRVARSGTVCGMDAALRAPMDGFTAGPGPGCPTHSSTRQQGANALRDQREPTRTKNKQPKKNPAEAGFFVEQHNQQRDQSPCCFCRCSQRSCASIVRSAVRRASRRSRPISSPVSTQKP